MRLPFFSKATPEEAARKQAQKVEKTRLAVLAKQQKAHDAAAREAAKADKKRTKQQAREWRKHEEELRAMEHDAHKRIEMQAKQAKKRIAKLEKQHKTARRRAARRERKRVIKHRRQLKKLRKLQRKQANAANPRRFQRAIDALLVATATAPVAATATPDAIDNDSPQQPLQPPVVFKNTLYCSCCSTKFRLSVGRHHCRNCGDSICRKCVGATKQLLPWHDKPLKRHKVCSACTTRVFSDAAVPLPTALPAAPASSTASSRPASGSGISISIPSRSARRLRRNGSNSASSSSLTSTTTASPPNALTKKPSLWTLPIRPLLKRKRSVEQLRNRQLDVALQLEKAAQLANQRSLAVELQPQHTMLVAPLARAV